MYSLLQSMLTGIAQLDAEHQDLVGSINRIEEAEQRGSGPDVVTRLAEFRAHLTDHFQHEEEYLTLLQYPARAAHAKHHAETIVTLERVVEDVTEGGVELGGIAAECFNELLSTVVMMDMRVLDWQAEKRLRAG